MAFRHIAQFPHVSGPAPAIEIGQERRLDARRGASLVVWAINEGRECAAVVNTYLAAQR